MALGTALFADIDGDGAPDILISGNTGVGKYNTLLYLNDGTGNYTELLNTPFLQLKHSAAAFADVDGDNDPDLLMAGEEGIARTTKLYLNDGNGNFTEGASSQFRQVRLANIAFADVDGDSDLDVIITGDMAGSAPGVRTTILYRNDGNGNFTEDENQPFVGVYYGPLAFADVDGDNDQDVIITGYAHINGSSVFTTTLYLNDGNGNFSASQAGNSFRQVADGAVAFSDIDQDGDMDLVLSGKIFTGSAITRVLTVLYINDGNGKFTEVDPMPFEHVGSGDVVFADIDNDLDEDLLVSGIKSSTSTPDRATRLYTNDGNGNFTLVQDVPFDIVRYSSTAFADIDGDQDMDLLITGQDNNLTGHNYVASLYLNCNGIITGQQASAPTSIQIYPNPSAGVIHLELGPLPATAIRLVDLSGKVLSEEPINNRHMHQFTIDQPAGIYFIEVISEQELYRYRIIKAN